MDPPPPPKRRSGTVSRGESRRSGSTSSTEFSYCVASRPVPFNARFFFLLSEVEVEDYLLAGRENRSPAISLFCVIASSDHREPPRIASHRQTAAVPRWILFSARSHYTPYSRWSCPEFFLRVYIVYRAPFIIYSVIVVYIPRLSQKDIFTLLYLHDLEFATPCSLHTIVLTLPLFGLQLSPSPTTPSPSPFLMYMLPYFLLRIDRFPVYAVLVSSVRQGLLAPDCDPAAVVALSQLRSTVLQLLLQGYE